MGTCKYCGQDAGWFSKKHKECEEKHSNGVQNLGAIVKRYFGGLALLGAADVVAAAEGIANLLLGDVNSDGQVNAEDRLILTRYLAKWTGYTEDMINFAAADVNCDGKVNAQDRLILTRHLAGWIGYETLGA